MVAQPHLHRATMGLEGEVYLYHKMTPPPNLGHSWVIFEGWSQILPSTNGDAKVGGKGTATR